MTTASPIPLSVGPNGTPPPVRSARMQQSLALGMLSLEALTIAYLSQAWVLPLLTVLAGFACVIFGLRRTLNQQRVYDLMAFVAVAFFIKYLLTPDNPRYLMLFDSQPLALVVAEYALAMQVLQLFALRRVYRLPFMFPGTGVVALGCAGIVDVTPTQREMFLLSCLAFAGLAALFCHFSRRTVAAGRQRSFGRTAVLTIVLLAIGGLGWSSATALYRYEHDLDQMVRHWLLNDVARNRTGVAENSALGSVNFQKQASALDIMLRIRAHHRPEYMRVRSFDVFDGRQWLPILRGQTLGGQSLPKTLPPSRHGGNTFRLRNVAQLNASTLSRFEIWPDDSLVRSFPSPRNPVWLQAHVDLATIDSHSILRSDDVLAGTPYTIDVTLERIIDDPWFEKGDFLATLSTPPRQLDGYAELQSLADRLFADCQTPQDKIGAVVDYFHSNYSYSLSVNVPWESQQSPITWFLLEQPAAHCEFFASGAVILLRMGGLPSRYVTGFVVNESNPYSNEWIARNRDAHAWAEAWVPDRGWVTVEATVGGGVPTEQPVSTARQYRDFLATRIHQLRIEWRDQGANAALLGLLRPLLTTEGLTLLGLLACVALFRLRRRLAILIRLLLVRPNPRVQACGRLLRRVDRALVRLGFERSPQQTLDGFSRALLNASLQADSQAGLQEAAQWYRSYARLRYGRGNPDESLDDLAVAADRLVKKLHR